MAAVTSFEIQALVGRIREMRLETIYCHSDHKLDILPGTVYYRYFHADAPDVPGYIAVEKSGQKSSYCSWKRLNELIQSGAYTYIYPVDSYFTLLRSSFYFCRGWILPSLSAKLCSFENVCDCNEKLAKDTVKDRPSPDADDSADYF